MCTAFGVAHRSLLVITSIIIIIIIISLLIEQNILFKHYIYHIKLLPNFATCIAVEL